MTTRINLAESYAPVIAYYQLKLKNGHFYHGSTKNLLKRLQHHRNELEKSIHHNKKLLEHFTTWSDISVIYFEHHTIEKANLAEQLLIDRDYNDPLCCNIGTMTTRKGFWGGEHGMPQWMKDKISERSKIHVFDDVYRETCRQRELGKTMSEESKIKISNALKGKTVSDETRQKLSVALKGKALGTTRSREAVAKGLATKKALGIGNHTPESRAKIAEANFKAVICNGVEYPSCTEAGEAFGINRSTVTYRVNAKSERYKNWYWKA